LQGGRTLWLFGDSFVGSPEQHDRRGSQFVHNTIAISRCGADGFEIDYAWGGSERGPARAFLEREGEGWWWLFDGFVYDERLYIGLLEVERTDAHGPLALPFRFTGMQLARVDNPRDPPEQWRTERIELTRETRALPASAMVVNGGSVYLFSFIDAGDGSYPRGLARLPLAALDGRTSGVESELESLGRDGRWKPGLDPDDLRILMADTATEMSVHFHPNIGKWLALYNFPRVGDDFPARRPDDALWIRTAKSLEGPWSEPRVLGRVRELATPEASDPNTGCYAAKEHPQFATQRLFVTYVCNLFTGPGQDPQRILQRLLVDMEIYRPVPQLLDLPRDLRDLPHAGPR